MAELESPLPSPATRKFSADELAACLRKARQAQALWRNYTLTQRVECLRGFWAKLRAERARLIAIIHEETGKPVFEIEAMELLGAELVLKHFTRNAHRILQDQAAHRLWIFLNKRTYVRYIPRGVVGVVASWSLPFLSPFADLVPGLLAGNAVVLKPSEWATKTALWLEDRFKVSGLFPDGLFSVALGDEEISLGLAQSADMILFTGPHEEGRKLAAVTGERLIPAVLELGGKHAMIVAKDAHLVRAAKAAVWGAFANCGQLNEGVSRVYVEQPIYAEFAEAVMKELPALRQALAPGHDVDLGRLMNSEQLSELEEQLKDAKARGARVVGGEMLDKNRLLVTPAVVLDAKPDMLAMKAGGFVPVLAVMPVGSLKEAIALANSGSFALSASLWARNLNKGESLSILMETGTVCVNDLPGRGRMGALPFGGVKESGLGQRFADEGLRMFCSAQSVLVHEWPAGALEPWWFPYSEFKSRLLAFLARFS